MRTICFMLKPSDKKATRIIKKKHSPGLFHNF